MYKTSIEVEALLPTGEEDLVTVYGTIYGGFRATRETPAEPREMEISSIIDSSGLEWDADELGEEFLVKLNEEVDSL